MAKNKGESYFWISYSDLMTSLFFVMLVLFVLVIVLLHHKAVASKTQFRKMKEIEEVAIASKAQLQKIKEIEEAVNKIDSLYFDYNETHKKHILNIKVNFPIGRYEIDLLNTVTTDNLIKAGKAIQSSLEKINKEYPNIKYLLVIEGQASKDNYDLNYQLSYLRALELSRFWADEINNIDFGENCEVLISGSGTGGTMRETDEELNQRFLIHIIPKPGIVKEMNK